MAFELAGPGSLSDRVFFYPVHMKKVTAFIDGFNLYHSLALNSRTKKYRWLDLKKLCQCFITQSNEILTDVYYFTALAKWDKGKVIRHEQYIKALETTNTQIIYGNFKYITKKCRICYKRYKTFEEKETDVNIGLYLLSTAFQNKFDKFFLLTADSDLVPAIKMVQKYFPDKESHVIIPIHGRAASLKQIANKNSKIKVEHLKNSVFSHNIQSPNGTITKPKNW